MPDHPPARLEEGASARPGAGDDGRSLLHRVSRSVLWNATLLPIVTLLTAVTSVLIRRGFGLGSGVFDVVLGVMNTLLYYSSLGIPTSLTKFVPEAEAHGGRDAIVRLLVRAAVIRSAILVALLVPLNIHAEEAGAWLALGDDGVRLIRVLTVLTIARGLFDVILRGLQGLLSHLAVNLLSLAQAVVEPVLIAFILWRGGGIDDVVGALAFAGSLLVVAGGVVVRHRLPPPEPEVPSATPPPLWRFALFTYVFELSLYFSTPAFARPALAAATGDHEEVALFSVGYQIAFLVVGLVVSGFRGVYRPTFAHVRASGDDEALRRTFTTISKVQVALLAPVGVGLVVMAGDYVPLLYGEAFRAAVPITQLLTVLLFTETAFNLGIIILSVDERYRQVLGVQAFLLLTAPLFVWTASVFGTFAAAAVLGTARVGVVIAGYLLARRAYGLRFPMSYALRALGLSFAMGALLATLRAWWPTSVLEAIVLTASGAIFFAAGVRAIGLVGREEADLLRRANLPGHRHILRWLGATS